jgi:hypothetical protein
MIWQKCLDPDVPRVTFFSRMSRLEARGRRGREINFPVTVGGGGWGINRPSILDQVRRLIVSLSRFEDYPNGQRHTICNECVVMNMEVLAGESVACRDELVAILQAIEPLDSK